MRATNRRRFFAWSLTILTLLSCSDDKEEMDEWEAQMAKELKAENVQLSHITTSHTIDGVPSSSESYLQLKVYDSKVLGNIDHNKRLLTTKGKEICDIVLRLPEIAVLPGFNQFRLTMVETSGFWVLASENERTVTFKVH